jgi:hypothetical protein
VTVHEAETVAPIQVEVQVVDKNQQPIGPRETTTLVRMRRDGDPAGWVNRARVDIVMPVSRKGKKYHQAEGYRLYRDSGEFLSGGLLSVPKTIRDGDTFTFLAGNLQVSDFTLRGDDENSPTVRLYLDGREVEIPRNLTVKELDAAYRRAIGETE